MPRLNRYARRVALALLALLVVLAGIEMALQWESGGQDIPNEAFVADPIVGFRMRPGYTGHYFSGSRRIPIAINSLGLRDHEYAPRQPDRLRIYAIGDSFVWGAQVLAEETFIKQVEGPLAQRLGRPVEIVNGGIPGYSTIQALNFLKDTIDKVMPDVLLLGLFVNDVLDNVEVMKPGLGRLGSWRVADNQGWLRGNSEIYRWVRRTLQQSRGRGDRLDQLLLSTAAIAPDENVARGIDLTEKAMGELAEIARQRNLPFVVVLIPFRHQVHTTVWTEMLGRFELSPDEHSQSEPNRRLGEWAREHGIAVVDTLPGLQAAQEEKLYFGLHWTPRGHAIAAKATTDFLIESHVLDTQPVAGRE